MPHNQHVHWILIMIWDGDIYIMNPLPHPRNFSEVENRLSSALESYNAQTGRQKRTPRVVNLLGCPKQPGGIECGYVVMRYMRDIISDTEMAFQSKWAAKTRRSYTMDVLEEVRLETLEFIENFM
nr:PREDICTED: uncharacterized protein LOC108199985 [Daucus carota subsp. sativus]